LIYTIKSAINDEDYDGYIYSSDINIVKGTAVFLILGIVMIYMEVKHLF
jgi:hypothetical protein